MTHQPHPPLAYLAAESSMWIGVFFWLVFLLALIFGGHAYFKAAPANRPAPLSSVVVIVLFALLGWDAFGWPLHK